MHHGCRNSPTCLSKPQRRPPPEAGGCSGDQYCFRCHESPFNFGYCSSCFPDEFGVREFPRSERPEFTPEARSLGTSERRAGIGAGKVIDKYHSGLDLAGHTTGSDKVAAPDRSTETEVSDIGE